MTTDTKNLKRDLIRKVYCHPELVSGSHKNLIDAEINSARQPTDNAAYLINPNRPAEIADAMIKLINDEKLREHFKKMGLEQVKKFNWETAAKQWLEIIK